MKKLTLSMMLISFMLIFTECKDDETTTPPTKFDLILIHSDKGNMLMWLYDQTPIHKSNFLAITKEKYYDSLIFFYVKANEEIKTGDPVGNGTGGKTYLLSAEFHDSISHVYGAVGAVMTNNPAKSTHGSQFYIVVNKTGLHSRDKNNTVFGQIIDGMPVADAISIVDRDLNNKPLVNIYMKEVEVVQYTEAELDSLYKFKIPRY